MYTSFFTSRDCLITCVCLFTSRDCKRQTQVIKQSLEVKRQTQVIKQSLGVKRQTQVIKQSLEVKRQTQVIKKSLYTPGVISNFDGKLLPSKIVNITWRIPQSAGPGSGDAECIAKVTGNNKY
jgi:hypothetical protein